MALFEVTKQLPILCMMGFRNHWEHLQELLVDYIVQMPLYQCTGRHIIAALNRIDCELSSMELANIRKLFGWADPKRSYAASLTFQEMKTKFTLRTKTLEDLLAKMLSDRDTSLGHHFFKLGGTQLEYFPVAVRVGSIDDFTKHKFFDLTDPHFIFMPLVDTKGGKVSFCNKNGPQIHAILKAAQEAYVKKKYGKISDEFLKLEFKIQNDIVKKVFCRQRL